MAPDIRTDLHSKIPQTVETLKQDAVANNELPDRVLEVKKRQCIIADPNRPGMTLLINGQLTLMMSQVDQGEGQIIIEIGNETHKKAVGQVHFSRVPNCDALIQGHLPVQINSVFVEPVLRGQYIALESYQLLSKRFTVISDTIQTLDGATFWRLKLADLDDYHIEIIDQFGTAQAELRLQDNGQPVIYRTDDIDTDPLINATIWGFENRQDDQIYTDEYKEVRANYSEHRDHVVLVLVPELKN